MKELIARLKETFCVWFGHSNIVTNCFGYVSCARCGVQIADTLTGGPVPDAVLVGHDCDTCRKNYIKCTWRDKLFAPYPFTDEGTDQ